MYLHTLWKLDTCLCELIYSEYSILPPPKIFTIPPETLCIYPSEYFTLWISTRISKKLWLLLIYTNMCRGEFRSNCGISPSKIRHLLNAVVSRHFLWKQNDSLRDCRILRLCLRGLGSFVVWHVVIWWFVPHAAKDNSTFVLKNTALQLNC